MIGLMTPFRVNNYGTKLQAYAVQETMRELGFETEIVDYRLNREKTTPFNLCRKVFYKLIREKYTDKRDVTEAPEYIEKGRKLRSQAISAFDDEYLRISEPVNSWESLSERSAAYEAVVAGSDQIFNPVNISGRIYLLEWVKPPVRKVAFSPSFGVERIPGVLKMKYRCELRSFDGLSVREESGRRIMNELGFSGAVRTLDPTLVISRDKWHKLADDSQMQRREKYVMCYFLGGQQRGRDAAAAIAAKMGAAIVNLPHFKGYADADEHLDSEKLYDAGVPDFLSLIRGADCVVTDSFHATVFSILFGRKFVVIPRHNADSSFSTNSRLESFLQMLGLENRMCYSVEEGAKCIDDEIDFGHVEAVLDAERRKTRDFLRESLENDQVIPCKK